MYACTILMSKRAFVTPEEMIPDFAKCLGSGENDCYLARQTDGLRIHLRRRRSHNRRTVSPSQARNGLSKRLTLLPLFMPRKFCSQMLYVTIFWLTTARMSNIATFLVLQLTVNQQRSIMSFSLGCTIMNLAKRRPKSKLRLLLWTPCSVRYLRRRTL